MWKQFRSLIRNQLVRVILLLSLFCTVGLPAVEAVVKTDPAVSNVNVGVTFPVNVVFENVQNLRGGSIKIKFDPLVLEVKSVVSGGFLQQFGQPLAFPSYNNTEGWAQYDESILGSGDMAEGSGTYCTINFKSKAQGMTSLEFLISTLRDRDNMNISHQTQNGTVMVGGSGIFAAIKVWLEGPFVAGDSMVTRLKQKGLIPLTSPYSGDAKTVSTVPKNVVDWVCVELRQTPTGATVAKQSFFIKKDGLIVADDGLSTSLLFWNIAAGNYYLIVHQRNHLSVMSANVVALNNSVPVVYDFTTAKSKCYGGDAKQLNVAATLFGMYAGDGNQSSGVTAADKDGVLSNRNQTGYGLFDHNLSGIVTISDVDFAAANTGVSTHVPAN